VIADGKKSLAGYLGSGTLEDKNLGAEMELYRLGELGLSVCSTLITSTSKSSFSFVTRFFVGVNVQCGVLSFSGNGY
jgi:hypothetical protein